MFAENLALIPPDSRDTPRTPGIVPIRAIRTFDPRLLLGDRLGLTLYTLVARGLLTSTATPAFEWYERFIHSCGEAAEHSLDTYARLLARLQADGFDPAYPIYAHPNEFALQNGAHRCAAAIALGETQVPYHLRFEDDRTPAERFAAVFSPAELAALETAQRELIEDCPPELGIICQIRAHVRAHERSFTAPFSSKTRLPILRTYQSSARRGVRGKRSTADRVEIYGLREILCRHMRVLEIGCNCGFLTLEMARLAGHVTAFDVDPNYIALGTMVQRHFRLTNVAFQTAQVETFRPSERFDCVVSCAVHGWITLPFGAYIQHLRSMLAPGGFLVFESHELDCHPEWQDQKRHLLQQFDLVRSGWIDDVDDDVYQSELREFLILRDRG